MAFKEKVWRVSPCVEQLLPALARGTMHGRGALPEAQGQAPALL